MDYVQVLTNWCVRRGVPLPSYKEIDKHTYVTFLEKTYSVHLSGDIGMQCAAQEAYEGSGVFGKVTQVGFVPIVRRDKEFLVDLAFGAPGCLLAAVREAPIDVQVTAFAPYGYTVNHPTHTDEQPYNYTVYTTVHPGDDAYWARVDWYIQMRSATWQRDDTTIYIYSSGVHGDQLRANLEAYGISVVLM